MSSKKACAKFDEMSKRVKMLRTKLMTRQIRSENLPGFKFNIINSAAYRLLVHAEIEDYIESKAKEKIDIIRNDVNANGYQTKYIKEIFAISNELSFSLVPEKAFDQASFTACVNKLLKTAEEKINDNNGIKEASFTRLSVFCGFEKNAIDNVLLNSLESYGKNRGSVAHKSYGRVRNFLAPSAEVSVVEDIITLLKKQFYNV
ncbi:hypothetical protein [Atlantibacter hermannii]|uniref:hypothetical protein n=1 Tax=Atlantibacter hermannii TaxID=565 RepID=UPI0028AEF675|nr:hypothetical protein [Atlantibacter hermannii]